MSKEGACLVCGEPLQYFEREQEMTCVYCGRTFMSRASCESGHYICDDCHAEKGVASIMEYCCHSTSQNPVHMLQEMMDHPFVYMHGNEHHIMVGAALITAYYHAAGKDETDIKEALEEMRARGSGYPGGSCGFWGCCGAAVSAGMFYSIVTQTTPLSGKNWGLANRMTARALEAIGSLGGPRCCKRNSFTAVKTAAEFMKENCGVEMELPEKIVCCHSDENEQCIRKKCPYYAE